MEVFSGHLTARLSRWSGPADARLFNGRRKLTNRWPRLYVSRVSSERAAIYAVDIASGVRDGSSTNLPGPILPFELPIPHPQCGS